MYFPRARGRGITTAVRSLVVTSATAAVLALSPVAARGDTEAQAGAVPLRGPAAAGFDVSRLGLGFHGSFEAFNVTRTRPLREALAQELVAADTAVLATSTPDGLLALLTEQMAYHHVAQGRTRGHAWLVTFCVVCNTGAQLTPTVGGARTTFETVGVYDGMMVMQDAATGTIWHHVTGDALYGPAVGERLGPPHNVLHLTVEQLLVRAPDARIAISDRIYVAGGRRHGTAEGLSLVGGVYRPENRSGLSTQFAATLGLEDRRRPRMDLGLGIRSETGSRYYPRERLRAEGDALIDRVEGRRLLVYLDPVTATPAALFVTATRARMDGEIVRLDDGSTVRDSALYDSRGARVTAERPLQVFTRWYGFALTFPETSIFGEAEDQG